MTKEEPRSPYLPPTPSPSPPTRHHARLFESPPNAEPDAKVADSKTRHLARAHEAARRVQLDLLSYARNDRTGGLTGPIDVPDTRGNHLWRYTLEVEAIERGEKVKKRVSVLFPRRWTSENVSQATGSGSDGSVLPAHFSSVAHRFPLVRNLSLRPPPRRIPSFRSIASATRPAMRMLRVGATLEPVDGHAAAQEEEQPRPVSERTAAWARERQEECAKRKRLREVLSEGSAESDGRGGGGGARLSGDGGEAKRRKRCLCERRGREVSRLVANASKL